MPRRLAIVGSARPDVGQPGDRFGEVETGLLVHGAPASATPRRRGASSPRVPAQYAAAYADYQAALDRAGMSEHTRRDLAQRQDRTADPAVAGGL
jgi:hypothetical protein